MASNRVVVLLKTAGNHIKGALRAAKSPKAKQQPRPKPKKGVGKKLPESDEERLAAKLAADAEIAVIRRECELEPDDPGRVDGFDAGTRVGTERGR